MKGVLWFITIIAVLLISSAAMAGGLSIIHPVAGLDTKNRAYKAYPALPYDLRIAAKGGEYPYTYALTTSPPGMSINATTGVISWASPTTEGSPHTVNATVTDSNATSTSVSWTITVTTSGFYFVDAEADDGGDGTISSPWNDIGDFYGGDTYESKWTSNYQYGFVYFKTGTYRTDTAYIEDGPDNARLPLVDNLKPQVWIAYPGASPIIDLAGGFVINYAATSNFYLDGIKFVLNGNARGKGVQVAGPNAVIWRCEFDGGWSQVSSEGNNALIMCDDLQSNFVVQDSLGYDTEAIGLLGYRYDAAVISDNTFRNITLHAIMPKTDVTNWEIRNNHIYDVNGTGILANCYPTIENLDILYNLIDTPNGDAVYLNMEQNEVVGHITVFRNTLIGNVIVKKATATSGPFTFEKNIIINANGGDEISESLIEDPTMLIITDNLSGPASDGIVDTNGLLTSAYADYRGTHGFEIFFTDPEEPAPNPVPETTSGPILRTGTHLLRVGDSVLRIQ